MTHRNLWLNAVDVRLAHGRHRPRRVPAHAADVPLQRLGPAVRRHRAWARARWSSARSTARTSCAGSSARASRFLAGAPAVVAAMLDAASARRDGRAVPGRGTRAHRRRGRAAAVEDHRARRGRARLGVHRRSTGSPRRRRCSPSTGRRPSTTASTPGARAPALSRAGVPAIGVRMRVDGRGRGARPLEPRLRGLLGAARGDGRRRSSTAGSTPATAASSTARTS